MTEHYILSFKQEQVTLIPLGELIDIQSYNSAY